MKSLNGKGELEVIDVNVDGVNGLKQLDVEDLEMVRIVVSEVVCFIFKGVVRFSLG